MRRGGLTAWAALLPLAVVVVVAYLGSVLWALRISLSSSRALPRDDFVGLEQYVRLFESERWQQAVHNIGLYGVLYIGTVVVLGFLLAVFIDQKVRGESLLRTTFLYPYAMSFVATGLVWQWVLNPESGLQGAVQALGWQDFQFEWIVDQDLVMYCIVFAGVWQGSGIVMELMIEGLRGVEEEIWKDAKLDGIQKWRVYVSIVLKMMETKMAKVLVMLSMGVIKL